MTPNPEAKRRALQRLMRFNEAGGVDFLGEDGRTWTRGPTQSTADLEAAGYRYVGDTEYNRAAADAPPVLEAGSFDATGKFTPSPAYSEALQEADKRREANLFLATRQVETPKPRPRVAVEEVDSSAAPRPFQSLSELAPGLDMERAFAPTVDNGTMKTAGDTVEAAPGSAPRVGGDTRAQWLAGISRFGTGISKAGAMINEAISGAKAPEYEDNSAQLVREYVARQQAQREAEEAAAQAALKDPFSPESRRFQAALERMLPGVYGPEDLSLLSAADAPMALRLGEMRSELEARRAAATRQQELDALTARETEADIRLKEAQAAAAARKGRGGGAPSKPDPREQARQDRLASEMRRAQVDLAEKYDKMGAPGFYQRYAEAQELLEKHKGDLPGVGQVAGRMPDFLTSDEGVALRQAVGQMLAEYRKGVTGAGMSDSERAEYGRITGLLSTADENSFRQGVERLKRAMDERVRATAAGLPVEAVEAYAARNPTFRAVVGAQPTQVAPASGAPPTREVAAQFRMPDGSTVVLYADGTEEVLP